MSAAEVQSYFETEDIWGDPSTLSQRNVAQALADTIPADVANILDVGSGDGNVVTLLAEKRPSLTIVPCDASLVALAHNPLRGIAGDAACLPFKDATFDLVMTTDMLEHLSEETEQLVLTELFRVSRRFVMLGVPYRENLEDGLVRCPACSHDYHANWHMRSYTLAELHGRIPRGWRIGAVVLSGEPWTPMHPIEMAYRRRILNERTGWEKARCPKCGASGCESPSPAPLAPEAAMELAGAINQANSERIDSRERSEILAWVSTVAEEIQIDPPQATVSKRSRYVADAGSLETDLRSFPVVGRAVRGTDRRLAMQFPSPGELTAVHLHFARKLYRDPEIAVEDGTGRVPLERELSDKRLTLRPRRLVKPGLYGLIVRVPLNIELEHVELEPADLQPLLYANAPTQKPAEYVRFEDRGIPVYAQVTRRCWLGQDDQRPFDLPTRVKVDVETGRLQVVNTGKRRVLMMCHDQMIDRRILAQAETLVHLGCNVVLLALSLGPEDTHERIGEIEIHRIGLSKVVPENAIYTSYRTVGTWLNYGLPKYLYRLRLPDRSVARLVSNLSRGTWLCYLVTTRIRYGGPKSFDPLPFRSAFLNVACRLPCDTVYVHDLPCLGAAVEAAEYWSTRLVYDAHELYPEQRSFTWAQRRICRKVEAELIHKPDVVFTVNESIAREMRRRYGRSDIKVLLNALDPDPTFLPRKKYQLIRGRLGLDHHRRILLFQGGLSPHRNLEKLVTAMRHVRTPDVALVFLGDGALKAKLVRRADALGLINKRIFFLDAVPQTDLLTYSASADVGIIPYPPVDLNSLYCTPNKLFEYIQAGLPILAADSPELRRFVQGNGFGINAPMRTSRQIATAIDRAFLSLELVKIRENIQKLAGDYSWETQKSVMEQALGGILKHNPQLSV